MAHGKLAAQKLMEECGLSDINNIGLDLIVADRGGLLIEKPLANSDGRIVFGKEKALITINGDIEYEGKKRFVIAHELGHLEMHRHHFLQHNDNDFTLEYFKDGHQETEANQFASELLIPEVDFVERSNSESFGPNLLRQLANYYDVSITSIAFKYFELGNHPICLVFSYDNRVKYWKRHEDFNHYMKNRCMTSA